MHADDLGYLPSFLSEDDERNAAEQIDANYQHGGGWFPIDGYTMNERAVLEYPGDPPLHPLAFTQLRQETIILYEHDVVAIVQPDHSFVAARVD